MDYDSRVEVTLKQESVENSKSKNEKEVSLRQLLEVLIRRKFTVIIIAFIIAVLAFGYSIISNPNKKYDGVTKVIIQYNFDGIEKGLDPRGQRFDVGKIKSPAVLDRVVETLNLEEEGITSSDLRDIIDISPVVPGSVIELIRKKIEEMTLDDSTIYTGEDFAYYPNKFIVSLYIPKDSSITYDQGERILRETLDEYIKFFYDRFTDRVTLNTAFQLINYEDYDYPEVANIMNKQISIVQSYLSGKIKQHPDFRSQVTGLSFGDIFEGTSILLDMDINKLNSYIRSYKLSRNPETLVTTWQSRIRSYELEMAKLENESRITKDAIDRYEKDKTVILGSPDFLFEGLEFETQTPIYDELMLRYLNAGVNAANYKYEIDYIKEDIDLFIGLIDEEELESEYLITTEDLKKAEENITAMIDETSQKLHDWMSLTNETVDDYIENVYYDRAIMQLSPVKTSDLPIDRLRLNLAIGIVLGLMIGTFWAFFKEYWVKSSKEHHEVSST